MENCGLTTWHHQSDNPYVHPSIGPLSNWRINERERYVHGLIEWWWWWWSIRADPIVDHFNSSVDLRMDSSAEIIGVSINRIGVQLLPTKSNGCNSWTRSTHERSAGFYFRYSRVLMFSYLYLFFDVSNIFYLIFLNSCWYTRAVRQSSKIYENILVLDSMRL